MGREIVAVVVVALLVAGAAQAGGQRRAVRHAWLPEAAGIVVAERFATVEIDGVPTKVRLRKVLAEDVKAGECVAMPSFVVKDRWEVVACTGASCSAPMDFSLVPSGLECLKVHEVADNVSYEKP